MNPVEEPIRIHYHESPEHLAEAADPVPPRKGGWFFWLLMTLLGAFFAFSEWRQHRKFWFVWFALPFLIGALLLSRRFQSWQRRRALGAFKPKNATREDSDVICEIGEAGILVMAHGGTSTHYPWQALVRIIERPKGFLIYVAEGVFLWFPRAAFSPATDFERMIDLVKQKNVRFEQQVRA